MHPVRFSSILGVGLLVAALSIPVTAQWEEHDCEEYGHEVDVYDQQEGVDIYGGYGSVVLQFRRELLDETTNKVTHSVHGTEVDASSLQEDLMVEMSLTGCDPWYSSGDFTYPTLEGWEPVKTDPRFLVSDVPSQERIAFTDVYPGINFGHYEDAEQWEFDFVARPGSDWENIGFAIQGSQAPGIDGNGNLVYYLECAKLVLQRPVIYQFDANGQAVATDANFVGFLGQYVANGQGFNVDFTPRDTAADREPYAGLPLRDGPDLRIVSASHGTNGPPYDFHVSTYEITNREFVDFLNSSQANATNLLGTNMFFDAYGNVWINPEMRTRRDELFSLADSRITYDAAAASGERYSITTRTPRHGESYTNHPVTGVSWYGAAKYCNWLTLSTGRGMDQLCYREGTNTWDWAPISCSETNWLEGRFTLAERAAWLARGGYRMLMDNSSSTNSEANVFNEFYKAATWTGKTNALYAYGRDDIRPGDANFRMPNAAEKPDTMPVGFFDGSDHDGALPTRTNDNLYGIYDLSGNVSEWVTDVGITNSPLTRAQYGGSWMQQLPTISSRTVTRPYETGTGIGFRVTTMDSGEDMFMVRIPYYVCLCRYQKLAGEAEKEAEKEAEEEARKYTVLTVEDSQAGTITGIITRDEEEPEEEPGDEGGGGGGGEEPQDIEPEEETTVEL